MSVQWKEHVGMSTMSALRSVLETARELGSATVPPGPIAWRTACAVAMKSHKMSANSRVTPRRHETCIACGQEVLSNR
jgi:hypothetical protein